MIDNTGGIERQGIDPYSTNFMGKLTIRIETVCVTCVYRVCVCGCDNFFFFFFFFFFFGHKMCMYMCEYASVYMCVCYVCTYLLARSS